MATIRHRPQRGSTERYKPWEVRYRGPDLNPQGRLQEHGRQFATRPEAEEFLAGLPPVQQIPARCNCAEPRWLLVDKNVLALGAITCSICGTAFMPMSVAKTPKGAQGALL
jgi:hypothetical protein